MTPRIVSLNVGPPRLVEWHGRTVETGIYKAPVVGPVLASGVNLAGDDQADRRVHGGPDKAVYAYSVEDYAWWAAELARPFEAGTFGENFTTEGIELEGSFVGDRWHIGGAVFEVSQPREPCFKLGIRMGSAAFVELFGKAARPGAYLRIVEPGLVAAGDEITVVRAAEPAIRIAEFVGELTPEFLRRIVVDERVAAGWRRAATRALERLEFA